MKLQSKYQALIWEQCHVAGVLALAFFGVGAFLIMTMRVFVELEWFSVADANGDTGVMSILIALACAVTAVLSVNVQGHLTADIQPRLARLPMGTFALAAIPFVARALALVLLFFLLAGAHRLAFGPGFPWVSLYLVIGCYGVAQTFGWTRHRLTGLGYVIGAVALVLPPALRFFGVGSKGWIETYFVAFRYLAHPLWFGLFLVGCGGLAFLGVHWTRRDERYGLPTIGELGEAMMGGRQMRVRRFGSPLEAVEWFEGRNPAASLPKLTLIGCGLVFVVLLSIGAGSNVKPVTLSLPAQFLPLGVFFVASLVAGRAVLRQIDSFTVMRPVDVRQLASAKLLALVRAFIVSYVIAGVASAAFWWMFNPAEIGIFVEAWEKGDARAVDLAALVLGPLFLTGLASWIFMFAGSIPLKPYRIRIHVLVVFAVLVSTGVVFALFDAFVSRYESFMDPTAPRLPDFGMVFWPLVIVMLVSPTFSLGQAWGSKLISDRGALALAGTWFVLGLMLWSLNAAREPSYPMLAFYFGLAGCLVAPVARVPARLRMIRHE